MLLVGGVALVACLGAKIRNNFTDASRLGTISIVRFDVCALGKFRGIFLGLLVAFCGGIVVFRSFRSFRSFGAFCGGTVVFRSFTSFQFSSGCCVRIESKRPSSVLASTTKVAVQGACVFCIIALRCTLLPAPLVGLFRNPIAAFSFFGGFESRIIIAPTIGSGRRGRQRRNT